MQNAGIKSGVIYPAAHVLLWPSVRITLLSMTRQHLLRKYHHDSHQVRSQFIKTGMVDFFWIFYLQDDLCTKFTSPHESIILLLSIKILIELPAERTRWVIEAQLLINAADLLHLRLLELEVTLEVILDP